MLAQPVRTPSPYPKNYSLKTMALACTDTQKPSSTNWHDWRATFGEERSSGGKTWMVEFRAAFGREAALKAYNEQYDEEGKEERFDAYIGAWLTFQEMKDACARVPGGQGPTFREL